jgi:FlaG protein
MMEIRTVAPTAPAPSASTTVLKPPQPDQTVLGANSTTTLQKDTRAEAPTKAPPAPPIPKIRADLRYDESIKRVVGRVYDEATGEAIRDLPPAELIRLYAKTREMLGPLGNE